MYHAVEDVPRPPQYKHFYVLASEFAGQMQWLKRAGYTPITFDMLHKTQSGQSVLPEKPILLTFDDGYTNLLTNVHPLLRSLGFAYTVFLVPDQIGKTNAWVAPEGYEPTPLLNWEEIREMQRDKNVSFQPHTLTHPHLAQMPLPNAKAEMYQSREILEQSLQEPMTVLCYPYGNYNDEVVEAALDVGYQMAVTTEFGRVRAEDDLMRLPRISVYHVPPFSLTYGVGSLNFQWRVKSRKDSRPAPVSSSAAMEVHS